MYFTHKEGVSYFPQELLFESGGFFDLHSRMSSSDAIHLVWPENHSESNPSGRIHYARFNLATLSIDQHTIIFPQDTGRLPDIEVEPDGDVHISFEFWENNQTQTRYYLGYMRQINGEFQPLQTATFSDNQWRGSYPEMCIDPEGNAYFIGAGGEHPILLTFRNGQFGSPVQVTDYYNYYISYSTRDRRRILYGDDGRVHLFLTVSIAEESDTSTTRIVHVETRDGISFSEPEFITNAHQDFRFVSDPAILPDGSKILYYFKTNTLRSYFSLDRGIGYGNPRELGAHIGVSTEDLMDVDTVIRDNPTGNRNIVTKIVEYDEQWYDCIYTYRSCRVEHQEPYVYLNTFPVRVVNDEALSREDAFSVSIDIPDLRDKQIKKHCGLL